MPLQTDNKLSMLSDEILKYVTGIGSKVTMYNEEGASEIDALKQIDLLIRKMIIKFISIQQLHHQLLEFILVQKQMY